MPLFKNHLKKKSVSAPEEPKKGVRQLMAEQESGCEIRHVTDPKPEAGKVYQAEYWEIANVAGESLQAAEDAYDKIRYDDPRKAAEILNGLDACTLKRDRIDKPHPRLSAALPEIAGAHYASLDDALCALEKATYGFDLSGREAEKAGTQPAPEEPKAAFPNPSIRIEIDPNDMSAHVTADRITFDGRDLSGTYASINKAIAALGKAIADPYAKRKGAPSKKDKH